MSRTLTSLPADTRRAALEFVHRVLVLPVTEQPPLEDLLADLAAAFRVARCGLVSLPPGQLAFRYPDVEGAVALSWLRDPSVLEAAAGAHAALLVERPDQPPALLAPLVDRAGVAWVVFVQDEREFSDADRASLALAGHALGRLLGGSSPPRWAEQLDRAARQEKLETAAAVTRRLAHDFGNVLTGILGFTELALAQQIPASTPLANYLGEVYRAAQNGAQYTHQLRLFSRRQPTSSRGAKLSDVLHEQEGRLRDHAGLSFRLHVPTDLPAVALDAEQLHQALGALLDNAREALVGPGAISVSARVVAIHEGEGGDLYGAVHPGPHVEITIADTGSGLSPEAQARLFSEPFFTTKTRRRGFGLATAYGILCAHQGGLRLHPGLEGGVVARVLIPVQPTPPARIEPDAAATGEKRPGERILLVDDEPDVRRAIGTHLEQAGHRVVAVGGGQAALQAYFSAGEDPFRLVLTDVIMPGIDGAELARQLLKRDPAVRVLFLSGHPGSGFLQQDFVSHGFELVAKPFRIETLLRAIRTALDRPARPSRDYPANHPRNETRHPRGSGAPHS